MSSTFLDGTQSVKTEIDRALARAVAKSTVVMHGEIQSITPEDHGDLVESVTMDFNGLTGEVSTNMEYALRVEYGFKGKDILGREFNQAPQPYMRDGAKAAEKGISEIFKEETGKKISVRYEEQKV